MKHITYLLLITLVIFVSSTDQNEEQIEETGRIFPLLPPYQGVDFLANWRTLATLHNAVFTLLKSTITVSLNVILVHQLNIFLLKMQFMLHLCCAQMNKSTNISNFITKMW